LIHNSFLAAGNLVPGSDFIKRGVHNPTGIFFAKNCFTSPTMFAAQSFPVGVKGKPRSPLNSFFNRRSLELLWRRMISGATRLPNSRR